jgi:ATP-dependent DNA ligase
MLDVLPQLVGNRGLAGLKLAIVEPNRFAIEPNLAGVDGRPLPWQARRERLELLAQAFEPPYELSPVVAPDVAFADAMASGEFEAIVLKDRKSKYRDGSRVGWVKIKHRSWYEREAWRFEQR